MDDAMTSFDAFLSSLALAAAALSSSFVAASWDLSEELVDCKVAIFSRKLLIVLV